MANIDDFLGKGITFPVKLTTGGLPVISGGEELIKNSIFLILSWPFRNRIMLAEFGSRLEELLEEPNDDLLRGLVIHYILDSLKTWEQRINVLGVSVERLEDSSLSVELTYQIKVTGLEQTLTFPFYKTINT